MPSSPCPSSSRCLSSSSSPASSPASSPFSSPSSPARTVAARGAAHLGARAGLVQITVAGVLWGTTGVVVQVLSRSTELGAADIGFSRLAVAAAVLLVLSTPRLRLLLATLRTSPRALLSVGVGLGVYQALYFLAVTTAGVSVATVLSLGLAPVLTAGWEAVRARRRPGPAAVTTMVAAVVGLVLVTMSTAHPTASAPRPLLGLLAAAGSGLGYAVTTVLSRHVSQTVAARDLTTLSTAVGALALAPLALAGGNGLPVEPGPLAMLAYLGVVTTAVAYGLFYAGLRSTSGSTAAVLTLLEPLTAAVLAAAILSEPLSPGALAGGALLLGAVAALYLAPGRGPARSVPVVDGSGTRSRGRR